MRSATNSAPPHCLHLLLAVFCFFPGVLSAQSPPAGTITGRVTLGVERTPVPGATVAVIGTRQGTSCDAEGNFSIADVPQGSYEVEASFAGYKRERIARVDVTPGRDTRISFNLAESPFLLNDVVVTGSLSRHLLKDTPVITEVISQKELRASGSMDLAEVMRSQTGIEISTGIGQTQSAQLHGLSDSHVLILVDGERTTGRVDGAVDLGQIPLNTIEKIEVVKGPLSSVYGSEAIGGVVNIITKDPGGAARLTLSSAIGSAGRQDYDFAGASSFRNPFGENSAVDLFVNTGWNKYFGVDYDTRDNFMEMPEYDRKNVGVKTVARFSPNASASLKGSYYRDRSEWLAGTPSLYLNDLSANEKVSLGGNAEYRFAGSTQIRFSASLSRNDHHSSELTRSGFFTRQDAAREEVQTYRAQLATIPYETSLLTLGYEYGLENATSTRLSGGEKRYIDNVLYGEDEWGFRRFMFTFGGRFSNNSVFGSFFSPRFSLMWKATDNLTLRGSYGRGFRAPSIMELFIDFANNGVGYIVYGEPLLQPEKSHGYNVGIQYTRDDLLWFRVNLYYNQLTNLIDYYVKSAQPIVLTYRNIAEAVTKGVDVDIDVHPLENMTIGAGYAYTFARDGRGNDLPFRSPHSVNWKFQYLLPFYDLTVNLRGRWFDRKLVTDEQINLDIYNGGGSAAFFYTPSYMIVDARLSTKLLDHFELSGGVNNLADRTYYPFGQIKGREYFGGLSFTLK